MHDLRAARETRASEALKMKDEQLRILQEQNSQLLQGLDKVEVSTLDGTWQNVCDKDAKQACSMHQSV